MEEEFDMGLEVDTTETFTKVPKASKESASNTVVKKRSASRKTKAEAKEDEDILVNCLMNKKVIVRHIPRNTGMYDNPKHILSGGMAESAVKTYTVPLTKSGVFFDVLTPSEKDFLEDLMGLEYNALSVYKKKDNYWANYSVALRKQDNLFNLSEPDDYISFKVLLANKSLIAPSLKMLSDFPKATYQFVIVDETDETSIAKQMMNATMQCYKEYGKIEEDKHTLRGIIELLDGRSISKRTTLVNLQTTVNHLIQADSKLFLGVISDKLLPSKILIKRSLEANLIVKRGDYFYLKRDNTPLCSNDSEPTLNAAAKFINLPLNSELKMWLEAKIKDYE